MWIEIVLLPAPGGVETTLDPNSSNEIPTISKEERNDAYLGKGQGINMNSPNKPKPPKKFIIWKVRVENTAEFQRHCSEMVKMHKLAMLILLETKIADHKKLTKNL